MYEQENNHSDHSTDGRSIESSPSEGGTANTDAKPRPVADQPVEMLSCPYCRKSFDRSATKAMPFCSSRCRMIDLGLWLNEVHSIPADDIDSGEYGEAE